MSNEYDLEQEFKEEYDKITDNDLKEKLLKMKELVTKRINLEKQFKSEQSKLEALYETKYAPLYKERNDIISGNKNIDVNEVKNVLKGVDVSNVNNDSNEKGIADYWLTCLKNSSQFGSIISNKDEQILKHLKSIDLEYQENGDFFINFYFEENNEYFSPCKLTNKYIHNQKQTISKIESTPIQWKSEESNPTISKKKKNIKNSKTKEVKTVVKNVEVESFFNFFKSISANNKSVSNKKDNTGEEDEEDYEEGDMIEEQYELGVFVKDELIPYSLEYYLDLVDDEDLDDDEEDEMDDDEDDDEKPKKSLF